MPCLFSPLSDSSEWYFGREQFFCGSGVRRPRNSLLEPCFTFKFEVPSGPDSRQELEKQLKAEEVTISFFLPVVWAEAGSVSTHHC